MAHQIVEIELSENLQEYLRTSIDANKDDIRRRAQEARAVAASEQLIIEKRLEAAKAEQEKVAEVYDLMLNSGAGGSEIMAMTGLAVSTIIPKIKSLIVKNKINGTITKTKIGAETIYSISLASEQQSPAS